jgi:hypothetical protein
MSQILNALLGAQNPLAQWADQKSNTLGGLGAYFLSGMKDASAVQRGGAMDQEAALRKEAEAKQLAQNEVFKSWLGKTRPDLVPLLDAGVGSGDLFNQALKPQGGSVDQPSSVQEYEYAKANGFGGSYMDWLSGKGGSNERSLTPTYLKDANGNIVIGQLDKGGQVTPSQLPEGFTAIDPFAMAGGKTGATVDAKTVAAARAALPGMETSVSIAKKAFDLVRNDTEGRKQWFSQAGALPRGMWVQGGSPMANFQTNASQTLGQAFAQARETLKGGGPITDYEGKAATEAYSRAESALKQGDEKAFLMAVDDMEAAILAGYQKLVESAQGDPTGGALNRATGGGNKTSTGITYTVEP